MLRNNRGQIFTLIEILVVVAIIVAAGLWVANGYLGKSGKSAPGEPATPIERAQSVDCMNNLQQIRAAINMMNQTGDQAPASLQELESSGVTSSMTNCPISGKPYSYDPQTARVWCATPGHEKY